MYKPGGASLRDLIGCNDNINNELFSKKTINALLRCMLEPIISKNTVSMIFTRLKNRENLEGLIKRLEYSRNVEMYDILDSDTVVKDDMVELEFVIINSARYNGVLIWDYSESSNKDFSKIYFAVNSKSVNGAFEIVQNILKKDLSEKFYSYKPERRENELLNEAVLNIIKNLNENVHENEFLQKEELSAVSFAPVNEDKNYSDKIRHVSHEIKNQLSILDIYAKILEKKFQDKKTTSLIKKSISLITYHLNELKQFENLNLEERAIEDIIPYSIEMFEEIVKDNHNTIVFINSTLNSDNRKVLIDEDKFMAVLNNVIKNANESTVDDEIIVELTKDEHYAKVIVQNHGEPIEDSIKEKIFKDGFSTKKNGWGVGLSVCRRYLAEQLGTIELVASDENKTEFLIKIPLIEDII